MGKRPGEGCEVHCLLQPDLVLLDIGGETHDPTAALKQFLRDRLDTKIIGVDLGDNCIPSTTRVTG
jgi:hypothetical protein